VIERLEIERRRCADFAQRREVLLAAGRDAVDDRIGDRASSLREVGLGIRRGLREFLDANGERLRLGEESGLLVALRLRDLLAEGLLRRAQILALRDGGTPRCVGRESRIHQLDGLSSRRLRNPEKSGIVTEQLGVDHRSSLLSNAVRLALCPSPSRPPRAARPSCTIP